MEKLNARRACGAFISEVECEDTGRQLHGKLDEGELMDFESGEARGARGWTAGEALAVPLAGSMRLILSFAGEAAD
jgi:hypothetical protein